MLLSGKISHTVLQYFESKGVNDQPLLEVIDGTADYDSTSWFEAEIMESFLAVAEKNLASSVHDPLTVIAHSGVELRSWGILDSVLRMMPHLDELMAQPQKILGHFVAPEMKVDQIQREKGYLEFRVSDDLEAYPLSRAFILASLESLPLYLGKTASHGTWSDRKLTFAWETRQAQIFEVEKVDRQMSPFLMREIIHNLQPPAVEMTPVSLSNYQVLDSLETQLSKLSDYLLRAQQVIHLVSTNPNATQEIVKKVNWDSVKKNWPQTIEDCFQSAKTLRDQIPSFQKIKQGEDDVVNSERNCSPDLG